MSKTFGKIVIASTILAGAAVGIYSYMKKSGSIPAEKTSGSSDTSGGASPEFTRERNYVDLASTTLEKPLSEAKEAMSEVVGKVKDNVAVAVKEVREAFNEAVHRNDGTDDLSDSEDSAPETEATAEATEEDVTEKEDTENEAEFKEGLNAEEVGTFGDHIVGSETSEEFFDDENEEAL